MARKALQGIIFTIAHDDGGFPAARKVINDEDTLEKLRFAVVPGRAQAIEGQMVRLSAIWYLYWLKDRITLVYVPERGATRERFASLQELYRSFTLIPLPWRIAAMTREDAQRIPKPIRDTFFL